MARKFAGPRFARRAIGIAIAVAALTVTAIVGGVPASASPASPAKASPPPVPKMVAARDVGILKPRAASTVKSPVSVPTATSWPSAGSAVVNLSASQAVSAPLTPTGTAARASMTAMTSTGTPEAAAPGTPLWAQRAAGHAGGPRSVRLSVLSHSAANAAGVRGVLFTVATANGSASGTISTGISYAGFSQASGGNYGLGLGLVELPACALTTPAKPACQKETPVRSSVNDPAAQSVSAQVSVSASGARLVLAAATTPSDGGSPAGTYSATTLRPSGTWAEAGSSGSFTYSYPLAVPPAPSSLAPSLALSYASGSIDGQTASTQAQASWIGDGWSLTGGASYIEQSFKACEDDPEGDTTLPAADQTPDECYDGPDLTMSEGGASGPLVCAVPFSYTANSTCAASADNGAVITHHVNSGNGSGAKFTDYWTVTTRDGTTYYYGLNELPGWASGDQATNSVDTMPVYSSQSGDPCYSTSGFSASSCPMAYRWNLDYVTDAQGNAMAYYYHQDPNAYAADGGTSSAIGYVRDSYLTHIDYGFTAGNAYANSGNAPERIAFGTADRCFAAASSCDPIGTGTNASNWQDVPYTQDYCAAAASCQMTGPTFWSTVRLSSITTEQWNGSAYVEADSWALSQNFPPTGDGTSPTLFLDSITRTGADTAGGGSAVKLPAVTFNWETPAGVATGQLANRVNPGDYPPLVRFRIVSITTETGSQIGVTYETTSTCNPSAYPTPSSNTSSCFPVYWQQFTPATGPDWFNKYAVQSVSVSDPSGGSPGTYTSYAYSGAAWHYDDNETVIAKYRTYGQWRGYHHVTTYTGTGTDPQTESSTTYYQGMSDDDDSTAVTLTDSQGGSHDDADALAGEVLESTTYTAAGGPVDHSTINSYWVSSPVASRTPPGLPALTANFTGQVESWTRQAITDTGTTAWRETETDTSYDATSGDADYGLLLFTDTHGDLSQPSQATCSATSYAPANTSENLVGLPAQVSVTSGPCGGSNPDGASAPGAGQVNALSAGSGALVSENRTFYDEPSLADTWPQSASPTFPQASPPTTGDVSEVRQAATGSGSSLTWRVSSATVYDAYGRPTGSWDGNGNETSTAYTMTNGLTTAVKVTNALGQSTTTTYDPIRGLALVTTDPNGIATTERYDGLGRLTDVWEHNRPTGDPADLIYTYTIGNATTPTVVTTQALNDASGYVTSTTLYDALLRVRQTQVPTPQGGVLVSDDFYNSDGWEWKTNTNWWDCSTDPTSPNSVCNINPSSNVLTIPDSQVPEQTETFFDGMGRPIMAISYDDSIIRRETATAYYGDRTLSVPPVGGTPTATVTDALGRNTELDSYTSRPTVTTTSNNAGAITAVTISGGTYQATDYSYGTNQLLSAIKDAATGEQWTKSYNNLLGEVTGTTDPNAGSSSMAYDANGNMTSSTDALGHTITYTYDALNRKTGEYDGTSASAPQIASWTYDNSNNAVPSMLDPIGQLTTETSTYNGATYTIQQSGFNAFGESTGEKETIPSGFGTLSGTYTLSHTYSTTTGLSERDYYPAAPAPAGGTTPLPAEGVTHGYETGFDLPAGLTGLSAYTQNITYNDLSQVSQEEIGSTTANAYITNTYDSYDGALTDSKVQNTASDPTAIYDDTSYNYDPAGNITAETDDRNGSQSETQCYNYDTLDQLTEAWTATDNCAADPSSNGGSTVGDGISGSAYWTSWAYNALGDRTSQDQHSLTGGSDAVTCYGYGNTSGGQPDFLSSEASAASTACTSATTTTATNVPDADGNATTLGSQALTWTDDGKVATDTTSAGKTTYAYDADGNVLLAQDPIQTTIYLFGGVQQVTLTTSGSGAGDISASRTLALPGGGEAVRTGTASATSTTTSFCFEITDQHGTGVLILNSSATDPTWRQYDPFGNPRGATPANWPAPDNAFLGLPEDANTGLDILGARDYDPATGRFISIDPVLNASEPQALNGYSYAEDDPVNTSDPSGLMVTDGSCNGSDCYDGGPPTDNGSGGNGTTNTGSSTANGDGSGGSACGYTMFCTFAGWSLPPQPTEQQVVMLSSPFDTHLGVDSTSTVTVTNYQNPNTDWELFGEWVTGFGGRDQYFDQYDPMTVSLMGDPNNAQLMAALPHILRNPADLPLSPKNSISGDSNYIDTTGHIETDVEHLGEDVLGVLSGGHFQHKYADNFLGSYEESWTAVYRGPHTATVYFTATNQTNLNSFFHPEETSKYLGLPPPPGTNFPAPIQSMSLPYDAGPVSQTTQTFQWQATCTSADCTFP
jgi:RHS repeat-associated protein